MAIILISAAPSIYAFSTTTQTPSAVNEGNCRTPPWMDSLTDEQKETLQQKMDELKTAGATREEMRTAIDGLLTQWGIEVPEPPSGPPTSQ